MKRWIVLLVLVAACSSGGAKASPTTVAPTTATGAPIEAVDVCRAAVKDRVTTPESAKFDTVEAPHMNTAGTSWQIRGTVDTLNPVGAPKTLDYSCLVNPSTLPGDSVPWVLGDVTVTTRP